MVILAQWDIQVKWVQKAHLAQLVHMVILVQWDIQVRWVQKAQLVHMVILAHKEIEDIQDLKV
jgi:hypothetical protein